MLKRSITYEDFNGNQVTEEFYFNLTKAELITLEASYPEGFTETLKDIITTKDNKRLVEEFKKLIVMSYGVKSEDGRRFVKNEAVSSEFLETAAFQQLFFEIATDDQAASDFITAVMPRDLAEAAAKIEDKILPQIEALSSDTPADAT